MKCVILAAGMAKRLRPLTDFRPKCLLEIGGKSLLKRSMDALISRDIKDFVIVTGYLHEQIETFVKNTYGRAIKVEFVHNPDYETTNNIYSLHLACERIHGEGMLLLDSDLIYDERLLDEFLAEESENTLALVRHELGEEEMKVVVDSERWVREISKTCSPKEAIGESLGIEKMGRDYVAALKELLSRMMEDKTSRNIFYERAFELLIEKNQIFKIKDVTRYSGMELDTLEDYNIAKSKADCLDAKT